MSEWRVEFTARSDRQFRKLPKDAQVKIRAGLHRLAFETGNPDAPRQSNLERYQGTTAQWRLKLGDYRVVFTRQGDRLVILVLTVGNRRDVYKA